MSHVRAFLPSRGEANRALLGAAGGRSLPRWAEASPSGRASRRVARLTPQRARRWLPRLVIVVIALILALPAFAAAPTFPPLTGRVTDAANVLPADTVAALDAKLAALETATGTQLVVATVPDLQGYEIEEYGYQLLRAWGIGQKGKNNGAILIVAPNERKVRVEVGYGLEGTLTDALSSSIIQTNLVPAFKAGDMPGGIVAGTDALIALLQLPADQQQAAAQAAAQGQQKAKGPHISFGTIVWIVIILIWIISSIARRGRGRGYGPGIIWGPGIGGGWGGGGGWGDGGGFGGGGGGFSGGGGSGGGGGASGGW